MKKNLWCALLERHGGNRKTAHEILLNMIHEVLDDVKPTTVLWVRFLPPEYEFDLVYAAEEFERKQFGQ
jgi:hypothetical protein